MFAGHFADAYLQRRATLPGYTVVVWRGPHVAEPTQLSLEDAHGYWTEVLEVARALEAHFLPAKVNYQTLGNACPHLHTHVVLRYVDDPAPGRPLEPDGGHVPEDELTSQAAALKALLG